MQPKTGRKQVAPRSAEAAPGYPSGRRDDVDAGRRRFLRQIVAGSGALGLAGSLRLAQAQEGRATDFTILAEHAPIASEPSGAEPPLARRRARAASDDPESRRQDARLEPQVATAEWVTENRALWVEPGYLVLLQWRRPADDEAPVAALEGSAAALNAYLMGAVTEPEMLHDPERVHPIEEGIVAVLAPVIGPATIDVLHLDHDCNIICPAEEPIRPHVRGRMVSPGR